MKGIYCVSIHVSTTYLDPSPE